MAKAPKKTKVAETITPSSGDINLDLGLPPGTVEAYGERFVPKQSRLNLVYMHANTLVPYDKNPRRNKETVPFLKQSLSKFGWRVPLVIDNDNIIVAGHTRLLAAQELHKEFPDDGWDEIPCFIASDLSPEQLKAFRLIDNKVAELSTWDFDTLSSEISELSDTGIDMSQFGWTNEELDCLRNVVNVDCLTTVEVPTGKKSSGLGGKKMYESHDGAAVRISFGSLSFLVLQDDFENWNSAVHQANNYNPEAVIEDIAERLGLLDAKHRYDVEKGQVEGE